ncbi:MAG: phosphopantetheine-binding protein [bacterium]
MIAETNLNSKEINHIARRVAEIVIEELKLDDVTVDTFDIKLDLVDELGIDSMDLTAVVLVLQDEYDISIYEEDYPQLKTIGNIANYIQERRSAA